MAKKNWLLLVLALMLSVVLVACGGEESPDEGNAGNDTNETEGNDNEGTETAEEKILNIVETAEIPSMVPMAAEDSSSIQYQDVVYEGLYRLHPEKGLVSGIADYDQTEISEDGLTWTFHLRDASWTNGEPVTADDFVYAWRLAIDPTPHIGDAPVDPSFYGPYLMDGIIKNATQIIAGELEPEELGVEAVDAKTLVVTLEKPTPKTKFESFGAFSTFLPINQEFAESQGADFAKEVENMLFNGPFVMTEWNHEQNFKFEKNDQYWDKDNVALDAINADVVKDNKTALGLYQTGKIDRVGLSADTIKDQLTNPELLNLAENVTFFLKFNQDSANMGKYMQNSNFRKAIAHGFDKQAFIDVVYGTQSFPANFLVPKNWVSHPETGEDFRAKYGDFLEFDNAAAQDYWAKAKEELGFEEVTVSFISSDGSVGTAITEFYKAELEKNLPGLSLELKNLPFQERLEVTKAKEYEIVFSGWGPDYQDAISFIDMFITDGPNNEMGYSSAEYDELVEAVKGELALKGVERFEAMQEAEKVLLEDAAIAPVFQRVRAVLSKPYVVGMDQLNAYGPDYSYKYVDIQK